MLKRILLLLVVFVMSFGCFAESAAPSEPDETEEPKIEIVGDEDTFLLQMQLCDLGWLDSRYVSGKMDYHTRIAIKSFQTHVNENYDAGLSVDGVIGPKSQEWLDNKEAAQKPNTQTDDGIVYDPTEELGFSEEALTELAAEAMKELGDMRHILLLGMDLRPGETVSRTDTMIILSIDVKDNKIKLTSLQRDLYVEIPGRKNNRLNAAYVFGGADLLLQTVEKNFGIKIDDYVLVDLDGLIDIIDQLGGVDVYVDEGKVPRINAVIKGYNKMNGINLNQNLISESGFQHLNGLQAESWARYRYGDPKGDEGRNERQRELILMLVDKLREKGLPELVAFAGTNMDKVKTNLTLTDIVTLIPAIYQMKDAKIEQFKIPVDGHYHADRISDMAVYVPDRSATIEAFAEFLKK